LTDITEIKRRLTDRADAVAEHLLPQGRREGNFWVAGSTAGEPGRSLKVCLRGNKRGRWADYASNGENGDLLNLWCQCRRISLSQALDEARSWLGLERPVFEKKARTYKRPAPPKSACPIGPVFEYLAGRKLPLEVLERYRVTAENRNIVFQSFLPDGVLAFVKRLSIDRPDGKKKVSVEADCEPVLFGWQAIDPEARELAICEGEIDAMSACAYGIPAVSVPFGGGGGDKQWWIEAEFERLEQFETIFLALDHDDEGDKAAETIADRLGRHRCRRVPLPRKDLNQCLSDGVEATAIRQCFDTAQSLDPPELRRAGDFLESVTNLFWPLDEREPGYRLPWQKIGDKLVLRPGELTLWTGASGSGKSQVLSHALVAAGEQGAKICIASLEMAPAQLLRRMVKQAGNVDRPTVGDIGECIAWLDSFLWVFAVTGKRSVDRVLQVFEYARAKYSCDVFAIDSLMRLGVGVDDYEAQEKAVFDIVSWTIEKRVHVHLVAHSRKSDRSSSSVAPEVEDVEGTSEIGSNAFNIIGLWRNRALEDQLQKATDANDTAKLAELDQKPGVIMNVAKQRNGDWEGKCALWFSRQTYQYRSAHDDRQGHWFVLVPGREDAA
jgi:twinkle protein